MIAPIKTPPDRSRVRNPAMAQPSVNENEAAPANSGTKILQTAKQWVAANPTAAVAAAAAVGLLLGWVVKRRES